MIEDKRKDMGPLAGMETGLAATKTERNLIVACDMPFMSVELGQYLLSYLGEVPKQLCVNIWPELSPSICSLPKRRKRGGSQSLAENQLRMRHFLHNIHVKIVKKELWQSLEFENEEPYFFNMNSPDES